MDVEFCHWRCGSGSELVVAAWVAVVDEVGAVLLDTRIEQASQVRAAAGRVGCGGRV